MNELKHLELTLLSATRAVPQDTLIRGAHNGSFLGNLDANSNDLTMKSMRKKSTNTIAS